MSHVIYHQLSSINSVKIHQNGRNLLKISANMFFSKPPSQITKEWREKRMVHSIGQSGIFYPTVLKCLKQDFEQPTVVSYFKLKALFNQLQLQAKNKPAIRSFQEQLKTTAIWLSPMEYHSAIRSTDNITKIVTRLPNYLHNKFYKKFNGNDIKENIRQIT